MKKIILITQYFPPDTAGTGRVMGELTEDLSNYGFDIRVVAGMTHYFNRKKYRDYKNKISVKRIWHVHFDNALKLGRLLNFISFPLFLLFHLTSFRKADKIIMVSNPPTIVGLGAFLNILWDKKIYFILQDIYPDLALHLGVLSKKSFLASRMRALNKWAFQHIEKIIVLTDQMSKYLALSYNLPTEKISTITNWADTEEIYPVPKDNPWSRVSGYANKFLILYAGNISKIYDLGIVLKAAEHLKNEPDIVFLFVGEGGAKKLLQTLVKSKNLSNVDFMSYVAEEDYNKLLSSADCHLVLQNPGMENFNFPGKVYSYLASGVPIIGICKRKSELAKLIGSARAGLTAEDSKEMTDIIIRIKNNLSLKEKMGQNGREYTIKYYSKRSKTHQYSALLS